LNRLGGRILVNRHETSCGFRGTEIRNGSLKDAVRAGTRTHAKPLARKVWAWLQPDYAQLKPDFAIGSDRSRFPHAAKIALTTAGGVGGSAGSPNPVGGKLVLRK
jgi:hypothetical protein